MLTGFGLGLAYVPGVTMVGFYFEKRRSLAIGIAVSGVGIGTFIFPRVTTSLLAAYGLDGALLLIAGVCLHGVVIGALYRPWTGDRDDTGDVLSDLDLAEVEPACDVMPGKKCAEIEPANHLPESKQTLMTKFKTEHGLKVHTKPDANTSSARSIAAISRSKLSLYESNISISSRLRKRLPDRGGGGGCRQQLTVSICDLQLIATYHSQASLHQSGRGLHVQPRLTSPGGGRHVYDSSQTLHASSCRVDHVTAKTPLQILNSHSSNLRNFGTKDIENNLKSFVAIHPVAAREDVDTSLALVPQCDDTESQTSGTGSWIAENLNLKVFVNWHFLALCCNNLLMCFGLSVIYVHLVEYVKTTLDLETDDSALFISAVGVANFLARYVSGCR